MAAAKQDRTAPAAVDVKSLPTPAPGWAWAVHDGVEGAALLPLDSSWLSGDGWQQVKSTPPGGGSTTETPTEE